MPRPTVLTRTTSTVQRTISPAELYTQVDLPVVSIYYICDIVISTIIMYSYHQ